MTVSELPLMVVMGATGTQCRGMLLPLLQCERYRIRALTRDTASDSVSRTKSWLESVLPAGALERLEWMACDIMSLESLTRAFNGAHYIYAMTRDSYPPRDAPYPDHTEQYHTGLRILEAALATSTLKMLFWSVLQDAGKATDGKLRVLTFTEKADVFREMLKRGLKVVGVAPGWFMQNLLPVPGCHENPVQKAKDGNGYEHRLPYSPDLPFRVTDPGHDIGTMLLWAIPQADSLNHKIVPVGSRLMSTREICQAVGEDVKPVQIGREEALKFMDPVDLEMMDMLGYDKWEEKGFQEWQLVEPPKEVTDRYSDPVKWHQDHRKEILGM